jgi:hypothetical protein
MTVQSPARLKIRTPELALIFRPCQCVMARRLRDVWQFLDLAGARLCRRPAAAIATLLRLTLRAQPRSEASQFRKLPGVCTCRKANCSGNGERGRPACRVRHRAELLAELPPIPAAIPSGGTPDGATGTVALPVPLKIHSPANLS